MNKLDILSAQYYRKTHSKTQTCHSNPASVILRGITMLVSRAKSECYGRRPPITSPLIRHWICAAVTRMKLQNMHLTWLIWICNYTFHVMSSSDARMKVILQLLTFHLRFCVLFLFRTSYLSQISKAFKLRAFLKHCCKMFSLDLNLLINHRKRAFVIALNAIIGVHNP